MNQCALPSALVPPLDDIDRLRALISEATDTPPDAVRRRLDEEFFSLGVNVRQELESRNLPFHQWSDDLVEFYRQTDAFLYETCVWNARQLKCRVRTWMGNFFRNLSRPQRILAFGDGLGFDSLYLALAGHDVTYFEVSQRCAAFASRIFRDANVEVIMLDSTSSLQPASFDAIVCLDVLEHVPAPEDVIRQFTTFLRPGGLLVASAPFYYTTPSVGTHLMSNRRYSGDLKHLYRQHGLQLFDGRAFWDPVVLVKGMPDSRRTPAAFFRRALIQAVGILLWCGRWWNYPHGMIAQWLVRASAKDIANMTERDSKATSDDGDNSQQCPRP